MSHCMSDGLVPVEDLFDLLIIESHLVIGQQIHLRPCAMINKMTITNTNVPLIIFNSFYSFILHVPQVSTQIHTNTTTRSETKNQIFFNEK